MSAANMKRRMQAPVFLEIRERNSFTKELECIRRVGPMVRAKAERMQAAANRQLRAGQETVIVTARPGLTSYSGVKR